MSGRRIRSRARWLLLGFAFGVLLATVVVAYLTRVDRGRARVLAFTLETLGEQINGTLRIEGISGNLLTGAKLYTLTLHDPDDELLLTADSAYIDYRVASFVRGDILINQLVLYQPNLSIYRMPGDTLWNYQKVLIDTLPEPARPPRATLIENMQIVNAEATVRLPWEPTENLSPAEREAEIREALQDTTRMMVAAVPGGYLQTMLFEFEDALFRELYIAPDERGGTYFEIASATGLLRIWRDPPMRLAGIEGNLSLREGIVRFNAPRMQFPESTVQIAGIIDLREDAPHYDVYMEGERIELADLQWLYPRLPEQGDGDVRLWMQTRPDGLLILARDLRIETFDTRVVGTFGTIVGDTLRFVEVDLEANPLQIETVDDILPLDIPVEGLRIGAATFRGS